MAENWLAKAKRALRHGQYHIGEILCQREKLEGKIVITGGSAGIGLAKMKHLIKEGAFVYITGRRKHNSNCEFKVAVVLKDNPTALANYIVQDERPPV